MPVQAFLSLYLVLLAFFIVLASVSQTETGRAAKAIASVRASFPSDLPLGSLTGESTNLFVEAERSLPERVGRLVEADLPISPPQRDPSNRQIVAEVPLASLFEGTAPSRPGGAFLRRVSAFLAAPPEGTVLTVTVLLPEGEGLSADRAGRIARTLLQAGAPEPTVSVGIERNAAKSARFFFGLKPAGAPS